MRVLLTGDKGFVGRNFAKFLKHKGITDIVGLDIKDGKDCREFFRTDRSYFDLVIHCAAVVGGRMTIDGNPLAVATDFSIDSEFINWALVTKPGKVVCFSSSAAYPIELQTHVAKHKLRISDIDLNNIKQPDAIYGLCKISLELQAKFLQEAGVETYIFRPFSGYGNLRTYDKDDCGQDLDYPFPSFIQRALTKQDPFPIWGDGLQVRDWIHINDIVNAIWNVLYDNEHLNPYHGRTFNLGTGVGTNFRRLADICCEHMGYKPEKVYYLEKPVGVEHRVSQGFDFLSSLLKTKPITIEEGVALALEAAKRRLIET